MCQALLINIKMSTIVGIIPFMCRINLMLRWVRHEKRFISSGPGLLIRVHNGKVIVLISHPKRSLWYFKEPSLRDMFKLIGKKIITISNTPRLYSQWLNSVIYWLINHCTYWRDVIQPPVWFLMTSSITYIILRRRNVVFTTNRRQNRT